MEVTDYTYPEVIFEAINWTENMQTTTLAKLQRLARVVR